MTTEIRTPEELLALSRENGEIAVDGDLRITCDIPYSVVVQIRHISARWHIIADGHISADGHIRARGYISADGDIRAGGDISADGYIRAGGDLFWSHMHMPQAASITCRHVLPQPQQRGYWSERLSPWSIECMEGCYEEIIPLVQARLDEILASTQWTPTERWMLESLRGGE